MNQTTLERMRKMKFFGMLRAFKTSIESGKTESCTPDEMISTLINSEWDDRRSRGVERHIKNAKFRYKASIEELHYHTDRNIDRNQIMRFAECAFIPKHENILITGSTGIGKSYIASAIGHQACNKGYKVNYHNTAKLFGKLKMAKADGSYLKEMARLERQNLLILVPPDQMSNLIDENFEQIYEELKGFYTLKEFIEPGLNEIQKGKNSSSNQDEGL